MWQFMPHSVDTIVFEGTVTSWESAGVSPVVKYGLVPLDCFPLFQSLDVCKLSFIQGSINYERKNKLFENFAEVSSTNMPDVVLHFITETMLSWGVIYDYHSKENQSCSNNICIQY